MTDLTQSLAAVLPDPRISWAPIAVLLVIAIGFGVVNIIASLILGPSRQGKGKQETYESGMLPIGGTHKRFNVRFYIVAMIFLVIDVEIVFFYPWASIFAPVSAADKAMGGVLLVEIIIFVLLLLLAYIYAWGKGVFRWD